MGSLRTAMDARFHDLELSSPHNLEGTVKAVPGDPLPPSMARAPRAIRFQQLSFLRCALPLGLVPSLSPPRPRRVRKVGDEDDGAANAAAAAGGGLGDSIALQTLLLGPSGADWWTGIAGQFRPGKLVSSIRKECMHRNGLNLEKIKNVAKCLLDGSAYAVGMFSQISFTPDTSLILNTEEHTGRKTRRKALLYHKLQNHDIAIEAASPEIFLDRKGTYWEIPSSQSFEISSLMSTSGFRYRLGLHRNGGAAEPVNSLSSTEVPEPLMPGIVAKAAFSLEKSKDFWREKDADARKRGATKGSQFPLSYDVQLNEPRSGISGIIGGTCEAWFREASGTQTSEESHSQRQLLFSADMFGSLCYTLQRGKFTKDYNDLTRIDARMDISSAASFFKGASHLVSDVLRGRAERELNPLAVPRLNLIFQQQVAGPIVFRVDSRVSLSSPTGNHMPCFEDVMYGLSYSFRLLQSGKVVAWYSPRRKEAMVELRVFEF